VAGRDRGGGGLGREVDKCTPPPSLGPRRAWRERGDGEDGGKLSSRRAYLRSGEREGGGGGWMRAVRGGARVRVSSGKERIEQVIYHGNVSRAIELTIDGQK
jgi:hypothetical protein